MSGNEQKNKPGWAQFHCRMYCAFYLKPTIKRLSKVIIMMTFPFYLGWVCKNRLFMDQGIQYPGTFI